MSTDIFKNNHVLVTGGSGMIGTALCHLLLQREARVTVLDPREPLPDFGWIKETAENLTHKILQRFDVIFNLAAMVAGVDYNRLHHFEMFTGNVTALIKPVEVADLVRTPHFLQVSSVCVYSEEAQAEGCPEEAGHIGEPNGANAGYAWAKRIGERALLWSALRHAVIVRPANTYGVRDHFDLNGSHVIPALIRKVYEQDPIQALGTGDEVRDFMYVDDTARGMITAMERGTQHGIYNIGSSGSNAISIRNLAYKIMAAAGMDRKQIIFSGGSGGDNKRIVNGDQLRSLGWAPQVDMDRGIEMTLEWFQEKYLTSDGRVKEELLV